VTLTFDILTLKVVSELHVRWATSVPIVRGIISESLTVELNVIRLVVSDYTVAWNWY